jgi:hypothetical protein
MRDKGAGDLFGPGLAVHGALYGKPATVETGLWFESGGGAGPTIASPRWAARKLRVVLRT